MSSISSYSLEKFKKNRLRNHEDIATHVSENNFGAFYMSDTVALILTSISHRSSERKKPPLMGPQFRVTQSFGFQMWPGADWRKIFAIILGLICASARASNVFVGTRNRTANVCFSRRHDTCVNPDCAAPFFSGVDRYVSAVLLVDWID